MTKCEELRQSVLQAAIQGKLTRQRAEDGTAEELLEEIRKKKHQLLKEGKIKREKKLPEIDKVPFDIPENWKWVRFGDITSKLTDGSHKSLVNSGKGYPVISAKNIQDGKITFENVDRFVDRECFEKESQRSNIARNDIILGVIGGSIGKTALYEHDRKAIAQRSIAIIDTMIFQKYAMLLLNSPLVQNEMKKTASGSAQGGVFLGTISEFLVPLPPLPEQRRIVRRVNRIMKEIDSLQAIEEEMISLNQTFPGKMHDAILQAAMQGKITEQLESDGTSEALLKELRKEKNMLIKNGRIKKEKKLPTISRGEIPFVIPKNWKWVRLGDIAGKTIKRGKIPKYVPKSGIQVFAQKCNTKEGYIDVSLAKWLDESIKDSYPEEEYMRDQDIVINLTGVGTIGRVGFFRSADNALGLPIVPDSHVTVIRTLEIISARYIYYALKNIEPYIERLGTGSTNQRELKPKIVKELVIPLPPLAEQQRIVARLNELLPLCNAFEVV